MSAQRRRLAIVAALAILGLAGFAVWRFVLAPPALPPGVLAVSGRIEGDDSAVAAKTSGRIREITVREGDRVEAGQVIAMLDDEQVRAREDQATAAVRQAEARARLAQRQIAVLDEQLRQSRLGVDQSRAQLEEARANRRDLRVIAPFNGTVATRTAEPGEVVMAGTAIITLVNLAEVYLRAFVPEGQIGRVRVDQPARVYLDSAPTKPIEAYVMRIDPRASFTPENTYFREDRVKQVVGVKLRLKSAVGFAKPGMPADGEILVDGGDWPTRQARR